MSPLEFYKCLADETRLRCLMLITHEGEMCVCELTVSLSQLQPKISRHLAMLKKHGLLLDRREGLRVFYRINPHIPLWAKQSLYLTYKENGHYIQANLGALAGMRPRPQKTTFATNNSNSASAQHFTVN